MSSCELARVVRGVDPSRAREVAELFYLAFGRKLAGLALPRDEERGKRLLAAVLCLDEVYAALDPSGRVLGIALVRGHGDLLCVTREAAIEAWGPFGGAWRYAAYSLLSRIGGGAYPKKTRGLEGFSVATECRGKGIGAAMIDKIVTDARAEGAHSIELNVGDTNPARHLYERAGFTQTRTGTVGPFSRRLGFKRFVYYELEL